LGLIANLQGHDDAVQSVSFSPNDELLVSAASDNTYRIWNW